MTDGFESAERVQDAKGRQYHIGAGPGDVARYILTCGDPARAERAAQRLASIRVERRNREFVTLTGDYEGVDVTVMATGIGCDNTEIAVIEVAQIVDDPCFIRAGTCGSLQADIEIEDLVVSTASCRLENTSTWFVPEGYPAVADWRVVSALTEAADAAGRRWHAGITATASGFYGAQGRRGSGFEPRFPELIDELGRIGVKNIEMETSTLFTLAAMRGMRAGAVCTVFANRPRNEFISKDRKIAAEDAVVGVALAALRSLAEQDRS